MSPPCLSISIEDVWDDSAWRMVNFLFCERCGYPVPGKHGACHNDLHATYNGHIIPINGGWHDAADMSQQTLQTGEIAYSLLLMAERAKEKRQCRLVQPPRWKRLCGEWTM
ncbi:glycoside hydrolase family 9 protein [Bacteroides uniformis]|nr:glycoside hydrolase family 9 protein [Bacteroides uniformis]